MFEKFTERARRVIFFGRYEASKTGSTTIETEHLLLGLIRENPNLFDKIPNVKTPEFHDEVYPGPNLPPVSTSIDLPLSNSARRVLQYADKEHSALGDASISSGHLLLGILREVASPSAQILAKYGMTREHVIEKMKQEPEVPMDAGTLGTHARPPAAPSKVWHDDDATVVESVRSHEGHLFTTITRFQTVADGKKVKVTIQIRGPSGVHEFETEFDIPPGTTGPG